MMTVASGAMTSALGGGAARPVDGAGRTADPLADDHSVLLWEACAYADALTGAGGWGEGFGAALARMLTFLHYRLFPYLGEEERRLTGGGLRDEHMAELLAADHERLRTVAETLESCRTPRLVALAATALVMALDRHVRREQSWVVDLGTRHADPDDRGSAQWALPLVIRDDIDLDVLPAADRDALVQQRLTWLHPGDSVRLTARHDIHPLWQRLHACFGDSFVWTYDQLGPRLWRASVTRRAAGC